MTHRNQSLGDHTHSCAFCLLQHSIAPLVAVLDRQLSPFLHWSQSAHSTQHTAEQLHLPVCLPKIRVHLHPLAPSVIFIPAISSHPCLLSSHLCLNICSPPQITGFYRVPPCIQKCLHNAPVMGTSPSMAGWPRRSTSMWHTLFKQMAQSQLHLLERYNS